MSFVADLHIHSRFARACSPQLNLPNLAMWAGLKGIDVLGTGDCLHPVWLEEVRGQVVEMESGTYGFDGRRHDGMTARRNGCRFILTTEVALTYRDGERLRRPHILLFFPGFESVDRVREELGRRGVDLAADGRPVLAMSLQALCELVWSIDERIVVIPAHVWTPWFSLYGSKTGYDSLAEAFGEYWERIPAVETGLSSDPAMNWQIPELDQKAVVSFSDAHSLPKLGRELTVFGGEKPTYEVISADLWQRNIVETIEFFPEEGKYHYSGHRKCKVAFSVEQLHEHGTICPVCGRRMTVGVMQRVDDLAGRSETDLKLRQKNGVITSDVFPSRPGFRKLVPLAEIIAEALKVGVGSKKVQAIYLEVVRRFGSELAVLKLVPMDEIEAAFGERLAEGMERVRQGRIEIRPGYDGVYGRVEIWERSRKP